MTMAAQLMAAGADQQLIATKLQESHAINTIPRASLEKDATAKSTDEQPIAPIVEAPAPPKDTLQISHNKPETVVDIKQPEQPSVERSEEAVPTIAGFKPMQEITEEPKPAEPEQIQPPTSTLPPNIEQSENNISDMNSQQTGPAEKPLLGGILNSTTDQAAEDARRELESQQNKTILSHSYLEGSDGTGGADANPINSANAIEDTKIVDIFDEAPTSTVSTIAAPVDIPPPPPPAIATPTTGLPLPPPLPDFSTLPTEYIATGPGSTESSDTTSTPSSTLPPANPNDPSQFQIPSQ
jgi:hypothetical protein